MLQISDTVPQKIMTQSTAPLQLKNSQNERMKNGNQRLGTAQLSDKLLNALTDFLCRLVGKGDSENIFSSRRRILYKIHNPVGNGAGLAAAGPREHTSTGLRPCLIASLCCGFSTEIISIIVNQQWLINVSGRKFQ